MKLIVGLGNPGDKYQNTRHNLGFMVVDKIIADRLPATDYGKIWKFENKFKAEVCSLKTEDIIIIKPQTFMNNSGLAVKTIIDYFKISLSDLIIIHDELDLPLGKIKIREGGSAAGHHGIESIIKFLGSDKFTRVRIGIGNAHALGGERGHKHFDAEKFVVEDFTPSEASKLKHIIKGSVAAVTMILDQGLEKAQNQYN